MQSQVEMTQCDFTGWKFRIFTETNRLPGLPQQFLLPSLPERRRWLMSKYLYIYKKDKRIFKYRMKHCFRRSLRFLVLLHYGPGVTHTASYPWPWRGGRPSSFPACLEQGLSPCDGQGTRRPCQHVGSAPAGLGQGLRASVRSECPGDSYAAAQGFGR